LNTGGAFDDVGRPGVESHHPDVCCWFLTSRGTCLIAVLIMRSNVQMWNFVDRRIYLFRGAAIDTSTHPIKAEKV
jgi:hypothetical protein